MITTDFKLTLITRNELEKALEEEVKNLFPKYNSEREQYLDSVAEKLIEETQEYSPKNIIVFN